MGYFRCLLQFSELFRRFEKNLRVLKSAAFFPLWYNTVRLQSKKEGGILMTDFLQALSGKWKLDLLYQLSQGPVRWNQLVRNLPDAAPNVLTRQLRQLEQDGLVQRRVLSSGFPQETLYALTDPGMAIVPLLQAFAQWDRKYRQEQTG
jgi:DNA-binding HxlR family transcriptional regulator